ncbi:hypothetical protein [Aquimarina sp. I32.4]|uniref:hypothetical protein n=1 Tax=Aquimarina sp. I32.4 TaxID=2053903 RepID=UPI0011AEC6E0|nr:hypothetical protein [Aquimarina sp. I32.4]
MEILKTLMIVLIMIPTTIYSQSDIKNDNGNSSTETVTKIIRIKGPNGEEKIIKKQEVITKKSKMQLNPNDEGKTNQSVIYVNDEVAVKKSHSSSDIRSYTKVPDQKGFIMTFLDKSGNKVVKVRPLSGTSGYYIVNSGDTNNSIGYFDEDKNFIVEMYDSKTDGIITIVYRANNDTTIEN